MHDFEWLEFFSYGKKKIPCLQKAFQNRSYGIMISKQAREKERRKEGRKTRLIFAIHKEVFMHCKNKNKNPGK